MRFMASGFAEILLVELLDCRILVRFPVRHLCVELIERLGTQASNIRKVDHIGRLNGLAASVDTAAGAAHDLDKVVLLFSALDHIEELFGVGKTAIQLELADL